MKVVRFPFLFISLLIGALAVYVVMASTSIGSGCERVFRYIGVREIPYRLPLYLGLMSLFSITILVWLAGYWSYGVGGGCLLVLVLLVIIPIVGGW
jgi:hypothetical protein